MSSTSDNRKTLQAYNNNLKAYLDDQPEQLSPQLQHFIRLALKQIPKSGRVLELGGGIGRDAQWIRTQGYAIECTDAADSFVRHMRAEGLNARRLDVLHDHFGGPYSLIYESALLLHFTDSEIKLILQKSFDALLPDGVIAIRTKAGNISTWTSEKLGTPRYMHYLDQQQIDSTLEAIGFTILDSYTDSNGHDNKGIDWIHVISKKP